MIDIQKVVAVLFLCCIAACNSFQHAVSRPLTRKMTTCTQMQNNNEVNNGMSRRDMIQLAINGIGLALVAGFPSVSLAVVPSQTDLKRLSVGHSRIQYLLKDWDALTESCNNKAMSKTESMQVVRTEGGGGGFCDKTPLIVQDYLGYKSTNDPLFKADSLMLKAAPLVDDLGVMDEADYVDLVEQYRDKADQTSLLAYTSSWGEANPNGSKDATDDYLEQTKKVVMETEVLLRKIMGGLKLEILPPSEKLKA